jgi:hypothetical protein
MRRPLDRFLHEAQKSCRRHHNSQPGDACGECLDIALALVLAMAPVVEEARVLRHTVAEMLLEPRLGTSVAHLPLDGLKATLVAVDKLVARTLEDYAGPEVE